MSTDADIMDVYWTDRNLQLAHGARRLSEDEQDGDFGNETEGAEE